MVPFLMIFLGDFLMTIYTPNQYLQELRIQKSKELLVSTDLSCQEIAYRIGYDNPVYFSVLFKKMTHLSPTEYRKLYQPK